MRDALKSLRRKSMQASRTGGGDRALLISIGMADPEEVEAAAEGEEAESDDEKTRRKR